jgi:tRNA 5-methylaminomethyl-2-thiouridine biosynthesis bifunctional protein
MQQTTMQPYLLPNAAIDWEGDTATSPDYEDIYWHRGAAVEEKQHVFVNPLSELLNSGLLSSELLDPHKQGIQLSIGELGFGFGINFLLTAAFWAREMPESARLNFVSIEKHPVEVSTLAARLKHHHFPHADRLLEQYPPGYVGQHTLWIAPNIRLLLVFQDVNTALGNLDAQIDFWYLDGFSPSRNTDMWSLPIFKKLFARSRPGARLSTYSVAGKVRDGLRRAGFEPQKRPGFGNKHEMLIASKAGTWQPRVLSDQAVTVIGGGLAGHFCAEALQRRGIEFQLIDGGGTRPSDIPQLAVFPQLAAAAEARYRFSLLAHQYMQSATGFHQTGLNWQPRSELQTSRLPRIAGQFPDSLIELHEDDSITFADGGWFSFTEMRTSLDLDIIDRTIDDIVYADGHWQIYAGGDLVTSSPNVILTTGHHTGLTGSQLDLRAIRGQAITVKSTGINHVVTGEATLFPDINGVSVVSGTYARSRELEVDQADSDSLLEAARSMHEVGEFIEAFVGIRAASRDRLPIVDGIPYGDDRGRIQRASDGAPKNYQPGLYTCTAFGSRGATHARLCAEHLVSKIAGEPAALDLTHQRMLAATRFAIRDARPGALKRT